MADVLINLLQARTVLIRAGNAVGTGTLIAPGMVLTCAHVVRKAKTDGIDIDVSLPDHSEPGHFAWTKLTQAVYLSKVYQEPSMDNAAGDGSNTVVLSTEYPDVAVLEIDKKDHAMIALPKNEILTNDLTDGQFMAFGFQKKERDLQRNVPQAVSLNYSGEQVDGSIRKLMFTNGLIRPGMSGAALLNRENGQIVGLIHMTMSPNDDLGAYVIPIEKVWNVIKKWEEDKENNLYSILLSKSHESVIKKQYDQEYPRFPMYKKYGLRLIILPLLIFFALWWVFYHLGAIQDSGLISIILVAISISGKLIGDWLGDRVNTESGKIKKGIGKILFGNTFLISFALIIALLWTFTSSVWIYGNPESDKVSITFFSGNDLNSNYDKLLKAKGVTRFLMLTSPKGDTIKFKPKDREAKEFGIRSFSRQEFYYPKDFLLDPAMVIRFDPNFPKRKLMDDYRIDFEIERSENKIIKTVYKFSDLPLDDVGCLTFGRKIDIKDREEDWKAELARDPSIQNERAMEQIMVVWRTTEHISDIQLKKGDRIRVKVIRKSDSIITNDETYTVNEDPPVNDKLLNIIIKQPNT